MVRELSVQELKYQAVMAVLTDGRSLSEVAAQWGVSRQSVHAWLRRYEDAGLAGLEPRSTRPGACPHQMPGVVEAAIARMRTGHPSWGPRRIAFERARAGVEPVPSWSAVYRALVRLNLIDPTGTGAGTGSGSGGNAGCRWSCGRWTRSAGSGSRTAAGRRR